MTSKIELIVGTYEEFLLGYKVIIKDEKQTLGQSFADRSHVGAIKSLAVHKHFIATGSTDDRIFVYDMRTRKQTQILLSHNGTINALGFTPESTHLFSAGDDGQLMATHLTTWAVHASWKKAHDGKAVTHFQIHPSGKLALSMGTDLTLRTWNLIKGRVAYKKNLKSHSSLGRQPDNLYWSTTGDHFSLTGQRVVEIFSIQDAEVVRSQKTTSKPTSVCWINSNICLVGLEDGKILRIKVNDDEKEPKTFEAHSARVKSLSCIGNILGSASSNGDIKLWECNDSVSKMQVIASVNIGCRPTCISLLDHSQFDTVVPITNEKCEYKEEPINLKKKTEVPNRGTVVIEYENDDDTEDKNGNNEDESGEESNPEDESEEDDEDDEEEDNLKIVPKTGLRKRKAVDIQESVESSSEDESEEDDDDEEDDEEQTLKTVKKSNSRKGKVVNVPKKKFPKTVTKRKQK